MVKLLLSRARTFNDALDLLLSLTYFQILFLQCVHVQTRGDVASSSSACLVRYGQVGPVLAQRAYAVLDVPHDRLHNGCAQWAHALGRA